MSQLRWTRGGDLKDGQLTEPGCNSNYGKARRRHPGSISTLEQAMKDGLERLRALGIEAIDQEVKKLIRGTPTGDSRSAARLDRTATLEISRSN